MTGRTRKQWGDGPDEVAHGTYAGLQKHRRERALGPICPACAKAGREYQNARRHGVGREDGQSASIRNRAFKMLARRHQREFDWLISQMRKGLL